MEEITLKDTLMMVFHSRRCGMCLCFFWVSGLTLSSPEWKTIVFWASVRWRREGLFDEGDKLSLYIKGALFLSVENYLLSIPAMSMWIKLSSNGPQVHQITPLHKIKGYTFYSRLGFFCLPLPSAAISSLPFIRCEKSSRHTQHGRECLDSRHDVLGLLFSSKNPQPQAL